MNILKNLLKYSFIGLVLIPYLFTYYLFEKEQAIVVRWNKFSKQEKSILVKKPGLHIRIPFLDQVFLWDSRLKNTSIRSNPLMTAESLPIYMDFNITWKMTNLQKFFTHQASYKRSAAAFLTECVQKELELQWKIKTLQDCIQTPLHISKERIANQAMQQGIEIISVDLFQILPSLDGRKRILSRMESAQLQQAACLVEMGQSKAHAILVKSKKDYQASFRKVQSQAKAIITQGEIIANQILEDAYRQHGRFAKIYQHMLQYEKMCSTKRPDVLMLSLKHPLAIEALPPKKQSFFSVK